MTHSATKQRLRTFENLETKKLMTADIGLDIGAPSESMFEVGSASAGDSFSFGVEREMKESGEKGGTADMNIGVGELQECTVSKSMDAASMKLAQFAINGNSPGTAEIDFVEVAGGGDAGKEWHDTKPMGWDNTTHKKWTDNGIEFFVADSFSFGVEREMKESGEKGGTADMNIGVGELQECTVSKSMDAASAKLAQFAINGNSPSTAEIDFVEVAGGRDSAHTSHDSMGWDNVKNLPWESAAVDKALQSWNTVGDADDRPTEEVAF